MTREFYACDRYGHGHIGNDPIQVAKEAYEATRGDTDRKRKLRRPVQLCERKRTDAGNPYVVPLAFVRVGIDGKVYYA
jgi:hypothetical protein